jgi:hypothetical protein
MPNWCQNITKIELKEFDTNSVFDKSFMNTLAESVPSQSLLMTICPIDEEKDSPRERWGTKWDISDADVLSLDNGTIVIIHNTPWSPPYNAFDTAVQLNPRLRITNLYAEFGMLFAGEHIVDSENCKVTEVDLSPLNEIIFDSEKSCDGRSLESLKADFANSLTCSDALKNFLKEIPICF